MAISDVKEYTHLTEADVEQLGRELDAIRAEIEESRGDADAAYINRMIRIQRGLAASKWGFFLRAETMHGWYSYIEQHPSARNPDPRFHELSHGESFLALLETRFEGGGLYCLDEPEAALSFSSTLALIAVLQRVVAAEGQVLCATHSPVLASLPGARILEVGDWGLRETTWDDLELVAHWKRFLGAP